MSNVPDRQARLVTGRIPMMRETRYEHTSSVVIATVLVLGGIVVLLVSIWLSNLLPKQPQRTLELLPGNSGTDDGNDEEPLLVESPEDPSDDPSLANDQQETQLEEVLDRVVNATGEAALLNLPNEYRDAASAGSPGSLTGGTGSPLGFGGVGTDVPREKRWSVEFAERGSLDLYARQLDFFGIELGIAFEDGRIVYVSRLSGAIVVREDRIDEREQRLFMSWQSGGRVKADLELLKKAGISDTANGIPLHFYPAETEAHLARLEQEYAGRSAEQIRRTRFRVTGEPGAFRFVVVTQRYR